MADISFSDSDLAEFEALIQEKLVVAKENLQELQRAL